MNWTAHATLAKLLIEERIRDAETRRLAYAVRQTANSNYATADDRSRRWIRVLRRAPA